MADYIEFDELDYRLSVIEVFLMKTQRYFNKLENIMIEEEQTEKINDLENMVEKVNLTNFVSNQYSN